MEAKELVGMPITRSDGQKGTIIDMEGWKITYDVREWCAFAELDGHTPVAIPMTEESVLGLVRGTHGFMRYEMEDGYTGFECFDFSKFRIIRFAAG